MTATPGRPVTVDAAGGVAAADPVAAALLRRLVELRPASDPLHAFARTVLSGEATLRAAAEHPSFAAALEEVAVALEEVPAALEEVPAALEEVPALEEVAVVLEEVAQPPPPASSG